MWQFLFLLAVSTALSEAIDCSKYCETERELDGTLRVDCILYNTTLPPLSRLPYECFPPNMEELSFSFHSLKQVFPHAFSNYSNLTEIRLNDNAIEVIDETAFRGLSDLHTLNLGGNSIIEMKPGHFKDLISLIHLDLVNNSISSLESFTFIDSCKLRDVLLMNNPLEDLGTNAFLGTSIKTLGLSNTKITSFPTSGLSEVTHIGVNNVPSLHSFPSRSALPKIQKLELTYPSHCCQFEGAVQKLDSFVTIITNTTSKTPAPTEVSRNELIEKHRSPLSKDHCSIEPTEFFVPSIIIGTPNPMEISAILAGARVTPAPLLVQCSPQPDHFNSCDDVMGWWILRIAVWLVILLNFSGNIVILIAFFSAYRRLNAVRLFHTNMAFADLCMGIYLLIIASVDASTYNEYADHAVDWKTGGGCAFAGFLSVFASELSLFMLVTVTLERLYRLHYAMYAKKISTKQGLVAVAIGWLFALLMAILPLVGVSDYTVSAICLPFERKDGGLAYITFLLVINCLAFILILAVYIYLFYSVTGGRFNSKKKEASVFKKMAILVVVDFCCWFPIIVIGLIAAHGDVPITLGAAKVIIVFIYPLNACANPFLYTIFTRTFQRDFFEFWFQHFGLFEEQYKNVVAKTRPSMRRTTQASRIGSKRMGAVKQRPSQWSMGTNVSTAVSSTSYKPSHNGQEESVFQEESVARDKKPAVSFTEASVANGGGSAEV